MGCVRRLKGSWWIDFRDAEGIRRRKRIGPDKRAAQDVLRSVLGQVVRREHLGLVEDSTIGFGDFAELWFKRVSGSFSPTTQARWRVILDHHLKPGFQGARKSITAGKLEEHVSDRVEAQASPGSINLEITILKHLFGRAVKWEYLAKDPAKDLRKLRENPGRTRFLSEEEIESLLAACRPESQPGATSPLLLSYLRPLVLLALNSGMRRGEILGLTRRDVDWENRVATLRRTKNGDARHVFLNEGAISALHGIPPRLDSDRFFPFTGEQVTMAFRRACKRAGIPDFRFHDLRHTFASYHAMAGIQARGLQDLLGHRDGRMTTRYSHLSDVYLRSAVDQLKLGTGADLGTRRAPGSGRVS